MPPTSDNKRIWIISDGNPGHFNQSIAIADVLGEHAAVAIEMIEARLKLRGFLRPLLAVLLNACGKPFPVCAMKFLYDVQLGLPAGTPDLIISSGGKTAFLNVLLARRTGARNIFIGKPPGIRAENFTRLLVLEEMAGCGNCLQLDTIPTRITPAKAAEAGRKLRSENKLEEARLWCMLIGGASRSHRYTPEDWRQMALAMNALAERHDIRWLVTTSRRTGRASDEMLMSVLAPERVADAVYWSVEPRKSVLAYLGAAELVFSTQDSLTMITEAMASGKQAYAVYPQTVHFDEGDAGFYARYLKRNVEAGRLRTVPISGLAGIDVQSDRMLHFRPASGSLIADIGVALNGLLDEHSYDG